MITLHQIKEINPELETGFIAKPCLQHRVNKARIAIQSVFSSCQRLLALDFRLYCDLAENHEMAIGAIEKYQRGSESPKGMNISVSNIFQRMSRHEVHQGKAL
jgi:hypothetical protein